MVNSAGLGIRAFVPITEKEVFEKHTCPTDATLHPVNIVSRDVIEPKKSIKPFI